MRKFSANAYEIELPSDLQISPIFNVSDIYPFKNSGEDGSFIDWQGQLPWKEQPHIEAIMDKRVSKKTGNK